MLVRAASCALAAAALVAATLAPVDEREPPAPPEGMARYVFGLIRRGPAWTAEQTPETRALGQGHMQTIGRLVASGELVLAGPFEGHDELAGVFVYDVDTLEAARALADSDPAVAAGRFEVELVPWWGPAALRTLFDGADADGAAGEDEDETSHAGVFDDELVEASCGQCQFGLEGPGCDLAVRAGERAWFVAGTGIDDHGDAHAADGFCNAVRAARVSGQLDGERLVLTSFALIEDEG